VRSSNMGSIFDATAEPSQINGSSAELPMLICTTAKFSRQ
jgi:hypothetical protein